MAAPLPLLVLLLLLRGALASTRANPFHGNSSCDWLSSPAARARRPHVPPQPPPRALLHVAARQPPACVITSDTASPVKLLQQNGTADALLRFDVCPPDRNPILYRYASASSSPQVLAPADVFLQTVSSWSCQNVTAAFTFDAMVGQTVYTLSAVDAAGNTVCSAQVRFIIVGFTIFEQVATAAAQRASARKQVPSDLDPAVTNLILSGEANHVVTDYRAHVGDNLQTYGLQVQFPDGSDSTIRSPAFVRRSMNTIKAVSQNGATSPVQLDDSVCSIVKQQVTDVLDDAKCGAAFAQQGRAVLFGVRYEPYRDGQTTFVFSWDSFTRDDDELGGELYENVITIRVDGNPPPIISNIEPKGRQFYRAGGEEITLTFDNVDGSLERKLVLEDIAYPEVPGSFRRLDSGLYTAKYITQPGKGTQLDWTVDVTFSGGNVRESEPVSEARNEKISYVDVPLSIDTVSPPYASEGDVLTLNGYFDQFDPSKPQQEVYIGNKPLSELGIVPNVSEDTISFFVPARSDVGSAYVFPISIVFNSERTETDAFSYVPEIPLAVEVEVYGASYDNVTQEYSLGSCDITSYEATLPSGVSDPDLFDWKVFQLSDPEEENLLTAFPDIPAQDRTLRILPKLFGGRTGAFGVYVNCTVQGTPLNSTVTVLKTSAPIIGVTLSKPQTRSLSTPNVPVRVSALVLPPLAVCFTLRTEILYEWTYLGTRYLFSSLNVSTALRASLAGPSRLGREFIIPQSELIYGNISLSLLAYVKGDSAVRGFSTIVFSVLPAEMVPVIGYGSSRVLHSSAHDLRITGERSFNPDGEILGDTSIPLYEWTCRISRSREDFSDEEPCPLSFLPDENAQSFSISSQALLRLRNSLRVSGEDGLFYLQYSLRVGSELGMSSPELQTVVVRPEEVEIAALSSLAAFDNRGNILELKNLPSYDDILFVVEGSDASLLFEIISPPSALGLLTNVDNLVTFPGYYDPSSTLPAQSPALGIRAGTLESAQEYEVSVSIRSLDPAFIDGETRLTIRTQDRPQLVLPELPLLVGDTKTIFSATAMINLDNSNQFLFFFFLVSADGEDYCLDGCSGRSTINFRVTESGTFMILARLRDMQGSTLLDEEFFRTNITVSGDSAATNSLSELRPELQEAYRLGDHGTLELLASTIIRRASGKSRATYSDADENVLSLTINFMGQIVQNSAPNTMASKSFVKTAGRFARLDSDVLDSEEMMYALFSIVDMAIAQVPRTESLDLENELLVFYNFSARHVFRALSGSSRRARFQQFVASAVSDGRLLLLDMYRFQQEHFSIALSRDALCGDVRHVDTIVEGGVTSREVESLVLNAQSTRARRDPRETYDFVGRYDKPAIPTFSSFTMGVMCSPEQAMGIRGETTEFTWCEEATSEAGFSYKNGAYQMNPKRKRLFTLSETLDYFSVSGLGDETDTEFLVTTNMTAPGSAGLNSFSFPQVPRCFSLNTSMTRLGVTASRGCLSAAGFTVNAGGGPPSGPGKPLVFNFSRDFSSVTANISQDRSSTVLITSSRLGIFGAVGRDCPINARKPIITPPEESIEFAYLVFGGAVVAVVGVTVTWVATSASYAGVVGAAAAA